MKKLFSVPGIVLIYFFLQGIAFPSAKDSLNIVFTANINGMIQHCNCGKEPLGGVARIQSFIDQMRSESEDVIFIDGGDYLNSYPYAELNQAMVQARRVARYDAMLPGDQEFVEGYSNFSEQQMKPDNNWILSNAKNFVKKSIRIENKKFRVEIWGYLSPKSFSFISQPENLKLSTYKSAFPREKRVTTNELEIMIFHGSELEAAEIRNYCTWIDLILLAHTQQQKVMNGDSRPIIGCGRDGEYVALIKAASDGISWDIAVDFVKMHSHYDDHPGIRSIIDNFIHLSTENSN